MNEKKLGFQIFLAIAGLVISAALLIYFFSTKQFSDTETSNDINEIKICKIDTTESKHHISIALGKNSEELEVVTDAQVKSIRFVSSDKDVCKVYATGSNSCIIESNNQGTAWITYRVVTDDEVNIESRLMVSVYEDVDDWSASVIKKAEVYRGAPNNNIIGDNEQKGTIKSGTKVKIIGECGSYYLIKTTDGKTFSDGKDTGYISKKSIK